MYGYALHPTHFVSSGFYPRFVRQCVTALLGGLPLTLTGGLHGETTLRVRESGPGVVLCAYTECPPYTAL